MTFYSAFRFIAEKRKLRQISKREVLSGESSRVAASAASPCFAKMARFTSIAGGAAADGWFRKRVESGDTRSASKREHLGSLCFLEREAQTRPIDL